MDNSRDLHCALTEEEEESTVSSYLYRGTVATGIVTSARPSLLMHSSNGRADITMPVATDNARRVTPPTTTTRLRGVTMLQDKIKQRQ
jgi:hypothetical protein